MVIRGPKPQEGALRAFATDEELEEFDLMDAEYWKEKYQESIETSNQ